MGNAIVAAAPGNFTYQRHDAYHVLVNPLDMESYFVRIKNGEVGTRLNARTRGKERNYDNRELWKFLVTDLRFDGMDFEHAYGLIGGTEAETNIYSFPESIILSHTLIFAPVLQHVTPLKPSLGCKETTFSHEG